MYPGLGIAARWVVFFYGRISVWWVVLDFITGMSVMQFITVGYIAKFIIQLFASSHTVRNSMVDRLVENNTYKELRVNSLLKTITS